MMWLAIGEEELHDVSQMPSNEMTRSLYSMGGISREHSVKYQHDSLTFRSVIHKKNNSISIIAISHRSTHPNFHPK